MTFNHENLNVYQRILPFNAKVVIWTGWKTLLQRFSVMTASMIAGIQ